MQSKNRRRALLVLLLAVATAMPAAASSVLHMDLTGLSGRAAMIFRATVLSVEPGSVAVGGGESRPPSTACASTRRSRASSTPAARKPRSSR